MSAPDKTGSQYKNSEQVILNDSRDDKYGVIAVELTAENPGGTALNRLTTDASGNLKIAGTIVTTPGPTDAYEITDIEKGVTYNYYGFTDADQNWYILRETIAGTEYRYFKGVGTYATNWTGRAALVYGYFFDIF